MRLSLRSVLFHALSQLLSWKSGSEEGAFFHPQRNVDLFTPIPSAYACSRPCSRPLCYAYSLCSFRANFFVQHLITDFVYPWRALAAFAPEKVFSDLIEAVLGAIYSVY